MINLFIFLVLAACLIWLNSCKKSNQELLVNRPFVNAGRDAIIAEGCNKAQLTGVVGSIDQSPTIFWKQISGPNQSTIISPNKSTTLLTNITTGTYHYVLQGTYQNGSASDTTVITVISTKEIVVDNLMWDEVDDIFDIWVLELTRPDLFCDTSRIKEISVQNSGACFQHNR